MVVERLELLDALHPHPPPAARPSSPSSRTSDGPAQAASGQTRRPAPPSRPGDASSSRGQATRGDAPAAGVAAVDDTRNGTARVTNRASDEPRKWTAPPCASVAVTADTARRNPAACSRVTCGCFRVTPPVHTMKKASALSSTSQIVSPAAHCRSIAYRENSRCARALLRST